MQDERPRPEDAGDASRYYDECEAKRYHTCQEVVQKQLELTARALEFLGLSVEQQTAAGAGGSNRPLIADIGCGSGLSGALLSKLQLPWLGLDISSDMLQLAAQHVEQQLSSSSSSSSTSAASSCCGLLAVDMGQGLPLRAGSLDGAISISALQWIVTTAQQATPGAPHQQQQQQQQLPGSTLWPAQLAAAGASSSCSCSQGKLLSFFSSLAAALVPGGAAVAQFYPRDPDEAQAVLASAAAAGLVPLLLVDFPHRTPARKFFLHVTLPADTAAAAAAAAASPECPLSWHIGGTCSLWHKQQQQQQQQHKNGTAAAAAATGGSFASISDAACHDVAGAWMQQQQQALLNALSQQEQQPGQPQQQLEQQQLQRVVCGVDAWVTTFHVKHCKKLLRLMWRAALDSRTVSIQQQQQVNYSSTPAAQSMPAAAAAGQGADQSDGNGWLKTVLQLTVPASLLYNSSASSTSTSNGTLQQDGMPAQSATCRQLNCYGSSLMLSCIGRAEHLAAAAAAVASGDEAAARGAAADQANSCQARDAAAAAAHGVARQLACSLAAALQQQHQQQQDAVQAQVSSAEWLATADLTPQRPTPQQQQSKRARRARKQFMQAALLPMPCGPAKQQQQQQQQHANSAGGAADNSSSSWMQLDVASGFAPHTVYSLSLPGWQPSPQQQQQQQQGPADIDSSCSGVSGIAGALLHGLRTVTAGHAGLGVYGALLVMHGGTGSTGGSCGLQMLLGCYGKQ